MRTNEKDGLIFSNALKKAIGECLNEGILAEFFTKHRNEVESMFTLEYDEAIAERVRQEERIEDIAEAKQEGRREGHKVGREEGREEIITNFSAIISAIKSKMPLNEISARFNIPIERVEEYSMVI